MATRKELIEAVGMRYREASVVERTRILDELVALAGYHRKHAIRLLAKAPEHEQAVPARNRLYDEAVRQALIVLWEAADRICGKRLKALIPVVVDAMERHGHLRLEPAIRQKLLQGWVQCDVQRVGFTRSLPSVASLSAAARTAGSCSSNAGSAVRTVSHTTSKLISKYPCAMRLRMPRMLRQGTSGCTCQNAAS